MFAFLNKYIQTLHAIGINGMACRLYRYYNDTLQTNLLLIISEFGPSFFLNILRNKYADKELLFGNIYEIFLKYLWNSFGPSSTV